MGSVNELNEVPCSSALPPPTEPPRWPEWNESVSCPSSYRSSLASEPMRAQACPPPPRGGNPRGARQLVVLSSDGTSAARGNGLGARRPPDGHVTGRAGGGGSFRKGAGRAAAPILGSTIARRVAGCGLRAHSDVPRRTSQLLVPRQMIWYEIWRETV